MTAHALALQFIGKVKELPGGLHDPTILWFLSSCPFGGPLSDEIAWCSGFANRVAWLVGLQRSHSLAARSWLKVGTLIGLEEAQPGQDVVIFKRGAGPQPGPDVINAPGHVFFFDRVSPELGVVYGIGGNQSNRVSLAAYPLADILGVRRLSPA